MTIKNWFIIISMFTVLTKHKCNIADLGCMLFYDTSVSVRYILYMYEVVGPHHKQVSLGDKVTLLFIEFIIC